MSRTEQRPDAAVEMQQRLVEALRNPALYPHPAPAIEVIETHISFVILTGPFAYKIKKAVDLGFVDYSTLERRHFFCGEELRLNRRLAPDIYLDVVAIGGDADNPRLDAAAAPIEYAVKMLEFPQDCLLDRLLTRNELTPRHIDRLAAALARFHAAVAVAAADDPHGSAEAVRLPMLQNFEQLGGMPAAGETAADLAAVAAWSRDRYTRLEVEITARHQRGFVRECHGDLHLGNMAMVDDNIEIFDGIEFNAELRWIDVINEVAFLVMDLCERGRADFGWRFLNAYLEITGDYAGVALLTYYMVYRAVVRAKVARFRSVQDDIDQDGRSAALSAYRGYLSYARSLTAPASAAVLVLHGLSGSGKSYLAQLIGERLGAVRIRSDVERKRLHGLAPLGRSDSALRGGIYGDESTLRTYDRLQGLARDVAAAGLPVIVDAANLLRRQRQGFRELAADLQLPFVIISCHAAADVLRQRLIARDLGRGDASEATIAVLRAQRQATEALSAEEASAVLSIDTGREEEMKAFWQELRRRIGR